MTDLRQREHLLGEADLRAAIARIMDGTGYVLEMAYRNAAARIRVAEPLGQYAAADPDPPVEVTLVERTISGPTHGRTPDRAEFERRVIAAAEELAQLAQPTCPDCGDRLSAGYCESCTAQGDPGASA